MLPFSPYPILLITLNTMLVASSDRIFFSFFYLSPFAGFFCLGGRGGRIFTPPRLFLMVRPLVLTKSRSPSRPRLGI